MLVAVYVRMSTDKQTSSIERQLDQINKHIASKGYTVYKTYTDSALKGHDWERPAFRELMSDADKRRFQGIVVDEESRFSRHKALQFFAYIAEPLSKLGVWLESVNEGRQDWDDMAGLIMATIRAEKSNSESSTLGRRVLSKWNLRAEQGKCFLGRQPYGYKYLVDEAGERVGLVPDEQEGGDSSEPAKIIRWLFATYINSDTSLRQLARELTSRAVATPYGGKWRAGTIVKYLRDRLYCGDYRFNQRHSGKFYRRRAGGELVKSDKVLRAGCKKRCDFNPQVDWVVRPDSHEALVSRDDFMLVQARLTQNADRAASPVELGNYPFLRLLVCSHCGANMVACKKKVWKEAKYFCGTNSVFGGCKGYSIRQDVVMGHVVDTLEAKFLDPKQIAQLEIEAKALESELEEGPKKSNHHATIARLDKLIANAEENLALVPQNRVQGILNKIADWEIEKAKAEAEMVSTGVTPVEELREVVKYIKEFLWEWREAMQRGEASSVYHLMRQIVSRVELTFETVKRKVNNRHFLVAGTVYFTCGKPVQFIDPKSIKPRIAGKSDCPQQSASSSIRRPKVAARPPATAASSARATPRWN